MKMKKILALVLAAVMALALVACGGGGNNSGNSGNAQNNQNSQDGAGSQDPDTSGTPAGETISLTLWGAEEDQALLVDLVEKFKAAYPDQTFDIKIGEESESTAKDTILTDIEAAADVFAFANDQIDDLIAAGALLPISGDMDLRTSRRPTAPPPWPLPPATTRCTPSPWAAATTTSCTMTPPA